MSNNNDNKYIDIDNFNPDNYIKLKVFYISCIQR